MKIRIKLRKDPNPGGIYVGTRVVRGEYWNWNEQDCDYTGKQLVGKVIQIKGWGLPVVVDWGNGQGSNSYGFEDLKRAPNEDKSEG